MLQALKNLVEASRTFTATVDSMPFDMNEWMDDLCAEIRKLFPKSWVKYATVGGGDTDFRALYFTGGSGPSEWSNGIRDNDKAYNLFFFTYKNRGGQSVMSAEARLTGVYIDKGDRIPQYHVMTRIGPKFRKSTGRPELVFDNVIKYFENLRHVIKTDPDVSDFLKSKVV